MIPFAKGHGLGNDYIVMNEADLPRPLDTRAIERVCDRNWGVGSDGILLKVPSSRADFGLRIFNPDGSEAEKSGNGLRIFAKYLWDHGDARGRTTFRVDTKGGIVECTCHVRDGRMSFVTVEMGAASFRASAIPMTGPDREAVAVPLELPDGGASRRVLGLNGRHDLEKRVSDRENGVRQAEVGDSRVAVRLAKREVPAKPLDGLLQVSRREDRLSKPRHAAPT